METKDQIEIHLSKAFALAEKEGYSIYTLTSDKPIKSLDDIMITDLSHLKIRAIDYTVNILLLCVVFILVTIIFQIVNIFIG